MKALVGDLKEYYEGLPKKSYACEMTRTNKGVCYTPGKDVELAFDALLKELRTYSVRAHARLERTTARMRRLMMVLATRDAPRASRLASRRKSSSAITAGSSSTPSRAPLVTRSAPHACTHRESISVAAPGVLERCEREVLAGAEVPVERLRERSGPGDDVPVRT